MGVKWAVKRKRKAVQIGTKWAKSEVGQQPVKSEAPPASLPPCSLTQEQKGEAAKPKGFTLLSTCIHNFR